MKRQNRITSGVLVIVALSLLFGGIASAQDFSEGVTKGWKHPWSGAKVGDRVTWKITSSLSIPGIEGIKIPGLGPKKIESERMEVVTRIAENTVWVERNEGDTKTEDQYYTGLPSNLVGKWAKTGEEVVKVGSKSFKCAIYENKVKSGNAVQITRVWKSADVPFWAVKATFSSQTAGTDRIGSVEELTAIDEVVKIGGKEYKCFVVRTTTEAEGVKSVETVWWNDAIPGRAAKKTKQDFMKGKETQSNTLEVVGFEKK
jgi:hypothetical protein